MQVQSWIAAVDSFAELAVFLIFKGLFFRFSSIRVDWRIGFLLLNFAWGFCRRFSILAVLREFGIVGGSSFFFHLHHWILWRLLDDSFRSSNGPFWRLSSMFGPDVKIQRRSAGVIRAASTVRLGFLGRRHVCSCCQFLDLGLGSIVVDLWTFRH